jgi:uncharacterized OsmC-like protein
MATAQDIGTSIQRLERAVAGRPGFGVTTGAAVATLSAGLRCTVEDGPWHIEADLSDRIGGTGAAPTPTALVRAALASCMAMTYRLRAARRGVPLTSVRVTVESESAVAGMLLAASGEPAGFRSIRYHVEIDSPAPHDEVMELIDEGDGLSPVLDVLTTALSVERTVTIGASTPATVV